jgi:catechol 2,3-dioxygenase-like lactoylglutathione lyase family enzyme
MLGQNLTHANFSVDDLATAKSFYIDKLGFTAEKQDEYGIVLRSGAGTRVFVYQKPDHQAWDSTVLGVEVDDVKAAVGELRASGISIEKLDGTDDDGIMTIPDMGEAAWFRDLQGTGSA